MKLVELMPSDHRSANTTTILLRTVAKEQLCPSDCRTCFGNKMFTMLPSPIRFHAPFILKAVMCKDNTIGYV